MHIEQLEKIGLSEVQALVLDCLLEHGESRAGMIAKKISRLRGVVYKALADLALLGLAEKNEEKQGVDKWRAGHPRALEKILAGKEQVLNQSKSLYAEILPSLISSYNITVNKPGVKFYEGLEGMKKVLDDTLSSKTEILLFINTEALAREDKFTEINKEYKNRRRFQGIKKRIIRAGKKPVTAGFAPEGKYGKITEIRYLKNISAPFKSSVQIYDGKISYQIIDQGNVISVLIEDKNIYELNKAWFEVLWGVAV